MVTVHVGNSCPVPVRNRLADLVVTNVIPANIVVVFIDLLLQNRIVRFHIHGSVWVGCSHHAQRCRGVLIVVANIDFIHDVVAIVQTTNGDGVVSFRCSDIYDGSFETQVYDLITHILYEVPEITVAAFQSLVGICTFHRIGVQRLNVVNDHVLSHRTGRLVQSSTHYILQSCFVLRVPVVVDGFSACRILSSKQLEYLELLANQCLGCIASYCDRCRTISQRCNAIGCCTAGIQISLDLHRRFICCDSQRAVENSSESESGHCH